MGLYSRYMWALVRWRSVVDPTSLRLTASVLLIQSWSAYKGTHTLNSASPANRNNRRYPSACSLEVLSLLTDPIIACCRFVFEADTLEVVVASKEQQETENAFVGGKNRWAFDTFTNWEFWWPNFPVLVYFKVRGWGHSLQVPLTLA
jgi:hypothetical protein